MATVLLLDNVAQSRAAAAAALTRAGHDVVEAVDAKGVLAAFRDLRVHCIVLSTEAAGADAEALTRRLKNRPPQIPLVVFSSHPNHAAEKLAERISARAVVFTSSGDGALRETVEEALAKPLAVPAGV